ncbi:MAG: hypothetical protein R3A46_14415 [Thermomicrobiales bacterium]
MTSSSKDTTWAPAETPVILGRAVRDAETDGSGSPCPLWCLSHSLPAARRATALAEHYASHGFIVLAPEHSEQFDEELGDLWKALIDRPADITETIDFAEELTARDGEMSGRIDMQNVAVVGHSYGGYTALAAAGARFDLEAFNARCDDLPKDDPSTFLCMSLVPNEANMSARAGFDAMPEGLWPAFADPRVTAIVPMAGDAYLFGEAGLAEINIPMMAMGGMSDFGTPYDWGAKPAYEYASSEQKSLVGLVGAEHMIFATPCDRQPWMNDHPANALLLATIEVWDANRARVLIHHLSTAFLLDTLKATRPLTLHYCPPRSVPRHRIHHDDPVTPALPVTRNGRSETSPPGRPFSFRVWCSITSEMMDKGAVALIRTHPQLWSVNGYIATTSSSTRNPDYLKITSRFLESVNLRMRETPTICNLLSYR